jgi:hypothetical protein
MPAPSDSRVPPVSASPRSHALPPSLYTRWGRPIGANSPRTRVLLSLYLSLSLYLVVSWASLVSSVFPTTTADSRLRARLEDHPHHSLTCPSSFFSPARTRSASPASFHPRSPSLVLCHRRPWSPEILTRRAGHPALQKPRRAIPCTISR